jgi:hypothetical protein
MQDVKPKQLEQILQQHQVQHPQQAVHLLQLLLTHHLRLQLLPQVEAKAVE